MADAAGTIISESDGGKSGTNFAHDTSGGTSRRSFEPEIIAGYDSDEPATIPIANAGIGKIDGRTRAGRAARAAARSGGTTNGTDSSFQSEKSKIPVGKVSLDKAIIGLHGIAASLLDIQELELDKDEGKEYADAVLEVLRHRNVEVNPEVMAWINLSIVMSGVYGTRYAAYKIRKHAETSRKPHRVETITRQDKTEQRVNGHAAEHSKTVISGDVLAFNAQNLESAE